MVFLLRVETDVKTQLFSTSWRKLQKKGFTGSARKQQCEIVFVVENVYYHLCFSYKRIEDQRRRYKVSSVSLGLEMGIKDDEEEMEMTEYTIFMVHVLL